MLKDSVVIFHARCPDGFGAAFAAWLALGERADYYPRNYGDLPPEVPGKQVYILDFCFEPQVMREIDASAASLTLLDHHRTSLEKMARFQCRCGQVHFDLTKSGARLAWEHFHPTKEVPELIRLIEDRDLWRWRYPETADYLAALDAMPLNFALWQDILQMDASARNRFIERGQAMNVKFRALSMQTAERALPLEINGVAGLMVNASEQFNSSVGELLAQKSGTFGAVWWQRSATTISVSLRSIAPFEVEPLARAFGGGGHPQAAGIVLPIGRIVDLVSGRLQA